MEQPILFSYYEVEGSTTRRYYFIGEQRVAVRTNGTFAYLPTDHLGSTALTLNSSGARQTELRYYPFGAPRYNANNQVTTYRFTGQRWDSGTALYFYQSRWYDPVVGRFLAADTIIPQPQNPQSLNRYSYCGSNPLRFIDPSGHAGVDFWGGGGAGAGVGLIVALMQGAQQTMTQAQGALYQYGPVAAEITWLYGNQTIAAGDQVSQAVQNAGQGGNTAHPGQFDPNRWDPKQTADAAKEVTQILKKYPLDSGDCSKAADRVYNTFTKAGYQAERVKWSYTAETEPLGMQLANGKIISTTRGATHAYHEFVRVGDRVFDAITGPEGMLWKDYLRQWDRYTLRWIVETVAGTP